LDNSAIKIRDAATIVLVRKDAGAARVLMGQRGAGAAFMPNKFVFPGGAVDPHDDEVQLGTLLAEPDRRRLEAPPVNVSARALAAAAIRELWEETGLLLGRPSAPTEVRDLGNDWQSFHARGVVPHSAALTFFFRAVNPPKRPRRFDARFFLADAAELHGNVDDFSAASGELSHLQWIALGEARSLDLPFITEVVLSEVEKRLARRSDGLRVPYFNHDEQRSYFSLL
jgi:8-oxo-dGTP pyrophosphatase MutT (NUDIX family)